MEVYSIYVLAYAQHEARPYGEFTKTLASSLGCIHARTEKMLMPSELAEVLRDMGAEQPDDSEALRRELEQATEAVELARARVLDLEERDRKTRDELHADRSETTPEAARRVMSAVPDVGPSFRDERERQDAHERLRALIAAGGATETGDRWLFDAAADEIVRLRGEVDGLRMVIRAARDELGAQGDEKLLAAAHRVAEMVVELRSEVEKLTTHIGVVQKEADHDGRLAVRFRREAREAREQGAAEMRERAAGVLDALADLADAVRSDIEARRCRAAAARVRALPLSGAPGAHPLDADAPARRKDATVKALEAMGVPFGRAIAAARIAEEEGGAAPEAAHSAVLRVAKAGGLKVIMCEGRPDPDMLRTYVRAMLQQAAAGERAAARLEPSPLTDEEQALLRRGDYVERDGRWRHMWVGPERDPASPDDLAELRRDIEHFRTEHGARLLDGLSADDVDALVDAMWRRDGDIWRDPRGQAVDPRSAEGVALMRAVAKDARERKARGPRLIETPADGLSAEDAETLRDAGWHTINGLWREPTGGAVYNPRHSPGINTLRDHAARIRERAAKAPPAASGVTGEPSGGDRAAGGKGSVAEAQGEKQGAPIMCINVCTCGGVEKPRHGEALGICEACGLYRAFSSGPAPAVERPPVALPKPPRVEVGQRWQHMSGPVPFTIRAVSRHNDEMCATLDTKHGQIATVMESWLRESGYWTFLGAPTPQGPSPKRDVVADMDADVARMRAALDRPTVTAEPTDGPTARDAVAGMLLRCGRPRLAAGLADGVLSAEQTIGFLRPATPSLAGDPDRVACIAALEALDRGDMSAPGAAVGAHVKAAVDGAARVMDRVALDRDVARSAASALQGEVERLTCERDGLRETARRLHAGETELRRQRDEARAEAAALREDVERMTGRAADLERQRDEACKDALEAMRELRTIRGYATYEPLRPAVDIAREVVSNPMSVEIGNNTEWAVEIGDGDDGERVYFLTKDCSFYGSDNLRTLITRLIERSRAEGKRVAVEEKKESDGSVSARAEAYVSRSREVARPSAVRLPVLPADRGPAPAQASIAPAGEGEAARGDEASDGRVSGMRIEKREDGEWLTGVTWNMSECEEMMTPGDTQTLCCHHVDGYHVANGDPDETGAAKILARWPIAPSQDEPQVTGALPVIVNIGTLTFAGREASDAEKAHVVAWLNAELQTLTFGEDRVHDSIHILRNADSSVRVWMPKDSDPRAVLATVAELLGLTGKPVETWGPDERSVEQIEAEAVSSHHKSFKERMLSYAAGIREGERRRQEYGLAAIGELARLQERDAAWSRVTGAGDPEQARSAFLSTGRVAIERARAEGIAEGERRTQARHVESPTVAPDREALGRAVHVTWLAALGETGRVAPPWESRDEAARERDRRVGERLFAMGVEEGERRAEEKARATARCLFDSWKARRDAAESRARDCVSIARSVFDEREATLSAVLSDMRRAYAYLAPHDDKPPTGGEPAPDASEVVADRATTHVEPTAGYARRRGLAVPATGWRAEPGMRTALSPTLGQVPVAPFKPWRCECGFEADTPDCHRIMDDPSAAAPYCTLRWARNPDYVTPANDADERPKLAAGQRWLASGREVVLRKGSLTDTLEAFDPIGNVIVFPAGKTAPPSWTPVPAAPPTDADARWQPGAVWEHDGVSRPPYRYEVVRRDVDGRMRLRSEDEPTPMPISPFRMTEANGWRYVGPASEAKPGEAFDGSPADVPPEIDEQAAEVAAIVDERVSKVLTQRRDFITADLGTLIVSATAENLVPHEIASRIVRRLEVAHGFAPVVPGDPSAIESERDARLVLAVLGFEPMARDRVLGTSTPAAQDGSSEPQDEPTEAPRD